MTRQAVTSTCHPRGGQLVNQPEARAREAAFHQPGPDQRHRRRWIGKFEAPRLAALAELKRSWKKERPD